MLDVAIIAAGLLLFLSLFNLRLQGNSATHTELSRTVEICLETSDAIDDIAKLPRQKKKISSSKIKHFSLVADCNRAIFFMASDTLEKRRISRRSREKQKKNLNHAISRCTSRTHKNFSVKNEL